MAFFRVRPEGFESLREMVGSDRQIALRCQVDPATLSRVLHGQTEPTARLIAGVMCAFGQAWINVLFEVVDEQ